VTGLKATAKSSSSIQLKWSGAKKREEISGVPRDFQNRQVQMGKNDN
jgi:hypothetical protein